jgi:hypothetical protein
MRVCVSQLVDLGPLPDEGQADVAHLQAVESALAQVDCPVTGEEALALLSIFPTDESSCFGLAWSILHLVETAPDWPLAQARLHAANPWVRTMLERAASAGSAA